MQTDIIAWNIPFQGVLSDRGVRGHYGFSRVFSLDPSFSTDLEEQLSDDHKWANTYRSQISYAANIGDAVRFWADVRTYYSRRLHKKTWGLTNVRGVRVL
ncbi:MAG: hypothetical protein WC291_11630 [Thermodesulfovibrionales bacterium]